MMTLKALSLPLTELLPPLWGCFLGGLLLIWALRRRRSKSADDSLLPFPPSPPGHWLLQNALDLPDPVSGVHLDILFLEWQKQYGNIFSITVPFFPRIISVGDIDMVRHILITANYRKSPTYSGILAVVGKESILVSEGKDWSKKRRAFNPGFAPDFLRNTVETIQSKLQRLVKRVRQDISSSSETHLHSRVTDFTSDVIAQIAFGEDWGSDDASKAATAAAHQVMQDLQLEVVKNSSNPLRESLHLPSRWKVSRLKRELGTHLKRVVHERTAAEETTQKKDILSLAIQQILKEKEGDELNDAELSSIVDQLKTFYFAGHDTTSTLISWTIWAVAQNPKVLQEIREELERHVGKNAFVDTQAQKDDRISYDSMQKCTFLDATLKEALRLWPPAATARWCDDPDATYGKYRIGRSVLYVNQYCIHRNPDYWDQPNDFQPERFLPGAKPLVDGAYLPFSRGPKDCIGKYFAMLEAKLTVATLLMNFDVEVLDPDETIILRITSRPMHGCKVRFTERQVPREK